MCENNNHSYVHLRTEKYARWTHSEGRQIFAKMIDTFFCDKCLDQKEVKKEYSGHFKERPDWVNDIQF